MFFERIQKASHTMPLLQMAYHAKINNPHITCSSQSDRAIHYGLTTSELGVPIGFDGADSIFCSHISINIKWASFCHAHESNI